MSNERITWNEDEIRRAKQLTLPNQLLADLTIDDHERVRAVTLKFSSKNIYWNTKTHPKIITSLDWTLEELRRYYGRFTFISYVGGNNTGTCPNHIQAMMVIPCSASIQEFCEHFRKLWGAKLRKSLNLPRSQFKSSVWVGLGVVTDEVKYLDYLSRDEDCELKPWSGSAFLPTEKMIIGRSLAI